MENQQPNNIQPVKQVVLQPHDKLLEALFFFWDAFERSNLNFFLVKDTAKQAISGSDLSGDKLTLGLRKNEWQGGQSGIFKVFMEHEGIMPKEKTQDSLLFEYKGVPVKLYLYDENPYLSSFDVVFYKNETFSIPNPFKRFCEEFDK